MRAFSIVLLGVAVAMAAPVELEAGVETSMTVGEYAQAFAQDPAFAKATRDFEALGAGSVEGSAEGSVGVSFDASMGGNAEQEGEQDSQGDAEDMPTTKEVSSENEDGSSKEASSKGYDDGATMEESYESPVDAGVESSTEESDGSASDEDVMQSNEEDDESGEDGSDSDSSMESTDEESSVSSAQADSDSSSKEISSAYAEDSEDGAEGSENEIDESSSYADVGGNSTAISGSDAYNATISGSASYNTTTGYNSIANSTIISAVPVTTGASYQVSVSPNGYSPKEMNVKKGDVITFTLAGAGPYSVTQSSTLTSCAAMAGGFDSKMLSGVGTTWNWTVPANAPQKVYVFSAGDGQCKDKGMTAAFTVTDSLVAVNSSTNSSSSGNSSRSVTTSDGYSSSAAALPSVGVAFATTLFAAVAATMRF